MRIHRCFKVICLVIIIILYYKQDLLDKAKWVSYESVDPSASSNIRSMSTCNGKNETDNKFI